MVLESARKRIPQLCDKLLCSLCIHNLGFAMQDLPGKSLLTSLISRLPGDCVLKCRRVCKQWLALTSEHMEGIRFRYSVYSLRNQLWRKLDNFAYQPVSLARPTILNGALHWMADRAPCSDSIMIFNMDTERLHNMPHPGGNYCFWQLHNGFSIFEMNGKLAFCCLAKNTSLVYMSVLDDYENWIWVNSCLVNLGLVVKCPFKNACPNLKITLLDIQDNELLFDWKFRGVFRYNLRQNTVKQISGVGMKDLLYPKVLDPNIQVIPYTKTFVLPSGFK